MTLECRAHCAPHIGSLSAKALPNTLYSYSTHLALPNPNVSPLHNTCNSVNRVNSSITSGFFDDWLPLAWSIELLYVCWSALTAPSYLICELGTANTLLCLDNGYSGYKATGCSRHWRTPKSRESQATYHTIKLQRWQGPSHKPAIQTHVKPCAWTVCKPATSTNLPRCLLLFISINARN